MNIKRTNVFLALAMGSFLLVGCGGGGGGGESAVTKETVNLTIGEGQSKTFVLTGEITTIHPLVASRDITIVAQGGSVFVEVDELLNDAAARYRVSHSTDRRSYETILSVSGINTSALPYLQQADALTKRSLETVVLADEVRLAEIILDLQYLAGEIESSEVETTMAVIKQAVDSSVIDIQGDISSLASTLSAYRQGAVSEAGLINALADTDSAFGALEGVGDEILDSIRPTLEALGVILPEGLATTYKPSLDRYTRFMDGSLGTYTNGQWVFLSEYDWLNAALRF